MSEAIAWLAQAEDIVGPKGINQNIQDMEPWLTDWRGRYSGKASAIISPADTQQVADIVKLAQQHKIPIVPQGGNSGLVGGATPDQSGEAIILSLRRMNSIRRIDTQAQLAVCDAGVILQNFHEALLEQGQRFPLTLGGKGSATLGGLTSTNAGGTQVLCHGTMRALVAGVEAVLPDGSIFNGLTALKKDNRGYDLKQLLIGGEGTLGIVTGITLKTVPALIDRCVAWIGLSSPQTAYKLLNFLSAKAQRTLEGFEILPDNCLNSVLHHIAGTRSPMDSSHAWHALVELVRDDAEAEPPNEKMERLLAAAIDSDLCDDAAIASSEAQAEDFWKIRDMIAEAERADGPALQHDISVPVRHMADFITQTAPIIEKEFIGTAVVAFGHLGDGNVHYHVKAPADVQALTAEEGKKWIAEFGSRITPRIHDLVVAAGGSISAEHGIGQNKRAELGRLSDPTRIHALRAIKNALDPHNIMNPGKLVPLASETGAS